MATAAQKRATAKYVKANTKQLHFRLNIKTDADIISWLDGVENVQGYFKKLIRDDIKYQQFVEECKELHGEDSDL